MENRKHIFYESKEEFYSAETPEYPSFKYHKHTIPDEHDNEKETIVIEVESMHKAGKIFDRFEVPDLNGYKGLVLRDVYEALDEIIKDS